MYHPRQSNLFYAKVTFSYNIGVSNSNISNVFLSSHLRYFPCEIPILIFEGFFQTFSHGMGTLATMGLCHRPGRILIIPTRGLACMETRLPYGNICIAGCIGLYTTCTSCCIAGCVILLLNIILYAV